MRRIRVRLTLLALNTFKVGAPPVDLVQEVATSVSMRHYLYVIELEAYKPPRRPPLPWVYVGQTTKQPIDRFEEHRAGGRNAALIPHRHAKRLIEELSSTEPVASTKHEAEKLERRLAEDLRALGYSVCSDGGPLWEIGHVVGACPGCGQPVRVRKRDYACGSTCCDFRIKSRHAGRVLPNYAVSQLIRRLRTDRPVDRLGPRHREVAHLKLVREGATWRVRMDPTRMVEQDS